MNTIVDPSLVFRHTTLAALLGFSGLAFAAPPQPAIDACGAAAEGAGCSFTSPNGSETGTCQNVEQVLACVPAGAAQPGSQPGGGTVPPTGTTGSGTPVVQGTVIGQTTGLLPDTGQTICYDDRQAISCPAAGQDWYGQDAQYEGKAPRYVDNGDGTVTDSVTGLMWQQDPDFNSDGAIDAKDKKTFAAAKTDAANFRLGGYSDWRLPTIKELYSLIDFSGSTGNGVDPSSTTPPSNAVPYLDTNYFKFAYGDASAGDRYIDAQYWSSTHYVSTTMNGNDTAFGVNFADGRIKGYPTVGLGGSTGARYVRYVRGTAGYGENKFTDNGDGTVTDAATELMWLQQDSGGFSAGPRSDGSLDWNQAMAWCEDLSYAGHDDWRLPNAKELQSLVDYTRSLATTSSAAIDPLFQSTWLPNGVNNSGRGNYPYYWTSTTHLDGAVLGDRAVYVAFGEARGFMDLGSGLQLYDVHGAGAQRSDLKTGDPATLPVAQGPQGDVQSIYDYARCVRDAVPSGGGVPVSGASYDAASGTVDLSVVDAGSLGFFHVVLKLAASNPLTFEVVSATAVATGTPVASYDPASGVLAIPSVSVAGKNFAATLRQLPGVLRFVVADLG